MNLVIDVTRSEGTVTVKIVGELDTYSAPRLEEILENLREQARSEGIVEVVVEAADLDFVDSAGLRVLVTGRRMLQREAGASLRLDKVRPGLRRLLDLTGLSDLLDPVPETSIRAD